MPINDEKNEATTPRTRRRRRRLSRAQVLPRKGRRAWRKRMFPSRILEERKERKAAFTLLKKILR